MKACRRSTIQIKYTHAYYIYVDKFNLKRNYIHVKTVTPMLNGRATYELIIQNE